MRFVVSLGIGVLASLGLRALARATLNLTLHPALGIVFALVVIVVSWRLLYPPPWMGHFPKAREHQRKLQSLFEVWTPRWIGCKFIYIESYQPMHVLVSAARVGNRGLSISLRTLPTPGFAHISEAFRVGTRWDTIHFRKGWICEPNIPWELVVDEAVVEIIVQEVSESAVEPDPKAQSLRTLGLVRARLAAAPALSNAGLREEMIPSDSASMDEVAAFALSYDASPSENEHFDRSKKHLLKLLREHTSSGSLPEALDESRFLLSGIQTLAPGYRTEPTRLERDLVRHIRNLVRSRDEK